MQKKVVLLLVSIGLIVLFKIATQQNKKTVSVPAPTQKQQEVPLHSQKKSIFIPYWAPQMSGGDPMYDFYYYFGIRPTKEGAIENEVGYQKISLIDTLAEKQKKLVLRMLEPSVTEVLLQNKQAQKKLISEIKSILAKNTFSGIILDIEVPFTLQANKKEQITQFVQQMCTAVKTDYKTCSMLIYGDFAYRNRPYDLKKIGEAVDSVLLMAYDFHKPGGESGPNFPFVRRPETIDYGYDFKSMITDVTALVPKDKIEVVFGMYGYDWTLNKQGSPLKPAASLSVNSLKLKVKSSKLKVESNSSKEKSIQYIDEEGRKHIVWYEDEESAEVKTTYLRQQGIWQISFWALSYF